jgi:hypothetical protein
MGEVPPSAVNIGLGLMDKKKPTKYLDPVIISQPNSGNMKVD